MLAPRPAPERMPGAGRGAFFAAVMPQPDRPDEEPPLRAELFSSDQMAQHGRALAASHRLAPGRAPDRLLDRLAADRKSVV